MHTHRASIDTFKVAGTAHHGNELCRVVETNDHLISVGPRIESMGARDLRRETDSSRTTEEGQDGERRQMQLTSRLQFCCAVLVEIHPPQCVDESVPGGMSLHDDTTITDRSRGRCDQPGRDL